MTTTVPTAPPRPGPAGHRCGGRAMGLTPTADEWWSTGVGYCHHVEGFADADGDGHGDLAGPGAHLDHLTRLGVTSLWLQPFCPSPEGDDGYDVSDDVDPDVGTPDGTGGGAGGVLAHARTVDGRTTSALHDLTGDPVRVVLSPEDVPAGRALLGRCSPEVVTPDTRGGLAVDLPGHGYRWCSQVAS